MQRYLAARLGQGLLVLFVVATATFALVQAAPGGPSILLNPELSAEDRALFREMLGLDDPLPVQYARWLASAVRLDFGESFAYSRPVALLIADRLPATLLLSTASLLVSVLIAIPLGVFSARFRGSWIDRLSGILSLIGLSIPIFWLGIMLIYLFSVSLRWLPSSGMVTAGSRGLDAIDLLAHLAMPTLVLALLNLASITRYTRSAMIEVLNQDYVRTARAKGLNGTSVMVGHALRNALVPTVTVIGLLLPRLVGGTVVTETIFSWPGIGRLAVDATFRQDFPLIMGITLMVSAVVVVSNLLVDLAYVYLDPRIRLT